MPTKQQILQSMRRRGGGGGAALGNAITAGINKIRRAMLEVHGRNLSKDADVFVYRARFEGVDANTTPTATIQIQTDSDFIWSHSVAIVTEATTGVPFLAQRADNTATQAAAAAAILSYPLRVRIQDGGLDRNITDQFIEVSGWFGPNASLPYVLPRPRLWKKSSSIIIELNRYAEGQVLPSWAATNVNVNVELQFHGQKIFDERYLNLTQFE